MSGRRPRRVGLALVLAAGTALGAAGCAHHVINRPLTRPDPQAGYRFQNLQPKGNGDRVFVILSFSGGGTRAAALAYGVLRHLAAIEIPVEGGGTTTLLDEVDVIYSVSGGSFPASYYALFGEEKLFSDFEDVFLREDVQGDLVRLLFNPANWFRLASPHYDRIDMAARYYHRRVFERATFRDLVERGERPFVVMNATDMGEGSRFEFTQDRLDYLCTDLSEYPVARGVAASSAFPGLLTPITLHNHASGDDPCDFQPPARVANALEDRELNPRRYAAAAARVAYLAPDRPYVHLMDGGVSDNIGLRGPYEALTSGVSAWSLLPNLNRGEIDRLVVVVVNAKRGASHRIDRRHNTPNLIRTLGTAVSTPMARYSFDTVQILREEFEVWRQRNRERALLVERFPNRTGSLREAQEVAFHDVEVSFERLEDEELREYLLGLPTTFSLSDEAVDRLIEAGPAVLEADEGFQQLLDALGATVRDRP